VRSRQGASKARPGPGSRYSVFHDLNGNGVVDVADYATVRSRVQTTLPAPPASAAGASLRIAPLRRQWFAPAAIV
jgi:hypothetical protein